MTLELGFDFKSSPHFYFTLCFMLSVGDASSQPLELTTVAASLLKLILTFLKL